MARDSYDRKGYNESDYGYKDTGQPNRIPLDDVNITDDTPNPPDISGPEMGDGSGVVAIVKPKKKKNKRKSKGPKKNPIKVPNGLAARMNGM